jgi:adenylyl-sulfate kinase
VDVSRGFVVWLTGLSGVGKSTIADELAEHLKSRGQNVEVLDGDVIRAHLSQGLGFSREDRDTNIRRIGFVAQLLARNGVAVIVAAISPYRSTREAVRSTMSRFLEVHVHCPVDVLVQRDTKGLYARALRGELTNLTGVSDPYEAPCAPEVTVHTDRESVEESVSTIVCAIDRLGWASALTPA